jgi:hypothetical protein
MHTISLPRFTLSRLADELAVVDLEHSLRNTASKSGALSLATEDVMDVSGTAQIC